MRILNLPLKAKWYDMIESGIKTEEYREFKPYWIKRFCFSSFAILIRMFVSVTAIPSARCCVK